MNWFTRLFKRTKKAESAIAKTSMFDHEVQEKVAEAHKRMAEESRRRGDIIGRQGGQKRNRTHIYRQPLGYPIRLCDWTSQDKDTIESFGEVAQGANGPAAKEALVMALDWAEKTKGAVICKHCRATVQGKREPIMAMVNHGHGTGAPLP